MTGHLIRAAERRLGWSSAADERRAVRFRSTEASYPSEADRTTPDAKRGEGRL